MCESALTCYPYLVEFNQIADNVDFNYPERQAARYLFRAEVDDLQPDTLYGFRIAYFHQTKK